MKEATEIVSSVFYYMWNEWDIYECEAVFGNMWEHFWAKYIKISSVTRCYTEEFYKELSENNREKLVTRANLLYNGMYRSEKYEWYKREATRIQLRKKVSKAMLETLFDVKNKGAQGIDEAVAYFMMMFQMTSEEAEKAFNDIWERNEKIEGYKFE